MKIYELEYSIKLPEYGMGFASSSLTSSRPFGTKRAFGTKQRAEEEKHKLFEAGKVLNINSYLNVSISEVDLEE